MTAACWGLAAAGGNGAASLAVWAVLLAAGTAFCPDGRKHPGLWAALALLLAGLYMLLTFTPPGCDHSSIRWDERGFTFPPICGTIRTLYTRECRLAGLAGGRP